MRTGAVRTGLAPDRYPHIARLDTARPWSVTPSAMSGATGPRLHPANQPTQDVLPA